MDTSFRLAEVLGALSLATDMSAGQMPESALGTTVLATRMGRAMGLSKGSLQDIYYTCVTRFIGCTATAMESGAVALGDDLTLNYAATLCDPADPVSVRTYMNRFFAPDAPEEQRQAVIEGIIAMLPDLPYFAYPHCEQAMMLAARLPLPERVAGLLFYLESRWDGLNPTRPGGKDVPIEARIIEFCVVAELFRRAGGVPAVLQVAKERAGGQFDPAVCALAEREADAVFAGLNNLSNWELYLSLEPGENRVVKNQDLATIATAFADFVDNKSGWYLGHSRQVATLAGTGAEAWGLSEEDCMLTHTAALLHDLGRAAVPNGILDKPGPLTVMEQRRAQSHSYHTENILALSLVFNPLLHIACSAHERCDGSGYHRHIRLQDRRAALVAAADEYNGLTHERPWRKAYSASDAADALLAEVSEGRLPREEVRLILDAAGQHNHANRTVYPDNLTRREVEVLSLLARGFATKEIAERLFVAPKTADNHIQNIYKKTGKRSRAAAAMYALEHRLIDN